MPNERLLKRIQSWSVSTEAAYRADINGLIESILDDLSKMYNTRQGTVLLDVSYGLPDFTSLMNTMAPPEIENLSRAFLLTTTKYETRLKNLTVRFNKKDDDFGIMRFAVSCKIPYKDEVYPLKFDALLLGDGSVSLQV
jgi:type VI secretion system protein